MKDPPRVELWINTDTAYGRRLIRAISAYSQGHGPWQLSLEPVGFGLPRYRVSRGKPDGVIARVADPRTRRRIARLKDVPWVDVSDAYPKVQGPRVVPDHHAIAKAAFDHLYQRGLRCFAYCGFAGQGYALARERAFTKVAASAGFGVEVFRGLPATEPEFRDEVRAIGRWLAHRDQAVGLMACNDWRARHVLEACRSAGLAVPDQVAVVGVDNDPLLCEASTPTLTSIDPGCDALGFNAARKLDALMQSEPTAKPYDASQAVSVVVRASTKVLMTNDPVVKAVLRRLEAQPLPRNIEDLLRDLPVSRRTLEVSFKRTTGRTPLERLNEVRLQQAYLWLRDPNRSVKQISHDLGYAHPNHFSAFFRRQAGQSPTAWRKDQASRSHRASGHETL